MSLRTEAQLNISGVKLYKLAVEYLDIFFNNI